MDNKMYRYLERFVGRYRVLAKYDLKTNDFPRNKSGEIEESFEDLYIPCTKGNGEIRHTYETDMLAFYTEKQTTAKSIVKQLQSRKSCPEYIYDDHYSDEAMIYFNAKDMDFFAKVFGAKTVGKNIPPFSRKNLPVLEYSIPKEDKKEYDDILSKLTGRDKNNFAKLIIDEFDPKIELYKGKKFNFKEDREKTNLDNLTYIHYVGLWDKFIRYARKRARQEFNISL